MSVCRGMKPTTTPLTFLIMHEFMEERNSSRSLTAYLFLGRAEKEEMSQQQSQDWDLDVSIADRAVRVLSKAVPSLGEGGRTAEGLRAGSWWQSPEPKSVPRAGSLVSQGFAGPCRPRLPKQLAGQQPRVGRAAGCSGVQGGGDGLAGVCLAPHLQCGILGQQKAQTLNPPYGPLLHSCSLRVGEVQQHLGREKLLMCPGSRHGLQQKQHCSAPGLDSHSPSRLPGISSKACSGVPAPRVPRRLRTNSPGPTLWPGRKADATLCRHRAPEAPAGLPLVTTGGGQPPCSVLSLHGTGVRTVHSRVDTPFPPG